jgi:hypothetical protein
MRTGPYVLMVKDLFASVLPKCGDSCKNREPNSGEVAGPKRRNASQDADVKRRQGQCYPVRIIGNELPNVKRIEEVL